jgi:hypothetical protein
VREIERGKVGEDKEREWKKENQGERERERERARERERERERERCVHWLNVNSIHSSILIDGKRFWWASVFKIREWIFAGFTFEFSKNCENIFIMTHIKFVKYYDKKVICCVSFYKTLITAWRGDYQLS